MFQFQGSSGSSSEKGYICDSDSDGDKVRKYIQLWIAFFVICVACNTIVLFFLYFLRIPLKKLALESSKISLFSLWILFKVIFESFIIALSPLKYLYFLFESSFNMDSNESYLKSSLNYCIETWVSHDWILFQSGFNWILLSFHFLDHLNPLPLPLSSLHFLNNTETICKLKWAL